MPIRLKVLRRKEQRISKVKELMEISKPEIWTKTNFSYKAEWNERTKQPEKVL
jgi:hypothetical protein